MANGVTPTGFVRPRLPEIRAEIVASLTSRLQAAGYSDPIETRPDSLIGLLIDTFAERETAVWEQAEAVYYAMYPSSAVDAQLDRAISFTGVTRLNASNSSVYLILYGTEGTVVPALSQVRNSVTQTLWETEADTTIGAGTAGDAFIRPIVANNATYTATIDGTARSYTSDGNATLAEILAGLGAAMTASGHTVTNDGAQLRIRANGRESFTLQVTSNLQITRLGTPALAHALDSGAITAAVGELSTIVTLVPGWDTVSNLQVASVGRLVETDSELRARYKTGVYRLGAATLPAIEANINSLVLGVTSVKVFENDDDVTDSVGRPPHSIHVVVEGGLDVDIAETIFQYKAGGIDTHGSVVVDVTDTEGTDHEIRFDRPTPRYIWVKAVVTVMTSGEETFPPDGLSRIRANILAEGEALNVGRDVIWQRFLQAIHAVGGVASADLKFAVTAAPTPPPASGAYAAANITIADFQVARFDLSRIEVT